MDNDKRARRIKRLKKEIKIVLLFLIIFPWMIVTVISVKNKKLSKENAAKDELLNQYLEQMEMLSTSYDNEDTGNEPEAVVLQGPKYNVEEMTKEEIPITQASENLDVGIEYFYRCGLEAYRSKLSEPKMMKITRISMKSMRC